MSAAALLVDARRSGRSLAALPDDVVPRDDAEAYAVQTEVMALLGATIAGWKVGAPSPTAPPSAAPLLTDLVAPSPATFAATSESFRAVEAELAFTLARDLPARSGNPYGEDEAWDAVAAVHVAIELLDSRFVDRVRMSPPALLADNLSNGGFTFGPAIASWRSIDWQAPKATLLVNGKTVKSAVGGNPSGHPRRLLAWLANHAASRGRPLRTGQVVTTGSHTGLAIAPLGARVVARFEGLGEAVLSLARSGVTPR